MNEKRITFYDALTMAKEQVRYGEKFGHWLKHIETLPRQSLIAKIADELCRVMAEVLMMPDNATLRISGEGIDAGMVKSIFGELRCEHIEAVAEEYLKNRGAVRNPKAYMRTMLYNSVLSLNAAKACAEEKNGARYGNFDVDDAFSLALKRSYGASQ